MIVPVDRPGRIRRRSDRSNRTRTCHRRRARRRGRPRGRPTGGGSRWARAGRSGKWNRRRGWPTSRPPMRSITGRRRVSPARRGPSCRPFSAGRRLRAGLHQSDLGAGRDAADPEPRGGRVSGPDGRRRRKITCWASSTTRGKGLLR